MIARLHQCCWGVTVTLTTAGARVKAKRPSLRRNNFTDSSKVYVKLIWKSMYTKKDDLAKLPRQKTTLAPILKKKWGEKHLPLKEPASQTGCIFNVIIKQKRKKKLHPIFLISNEKCSFVIIFEFKTFICQTEISYLHSVTLLGKPVQLLIINTLPVNHVVATQCI